MIRVVATDLLCSSFQLVFAAWQKETNRECLVPLRVSHLVTWLRKTHLELPRSPLLKYLNIGCELAMGYEQNDSNGWCNEYSRQSKKRASIAFAKSPHGKYCPAHQQFLYDVLYCYVSCIMCAFCFADIHLIEPASETDLRGIADELKLGISDDDLKEYTSEQTPLVPVQPFPYPITLITCQLECLEIWPTAITLGRLSWSLERKQWYKKGFHIA